MEALRLLEGWPCDNAAAGVARSDGSTHTHGDPDRRYRLASITKLLTAAAVMVAVEEETLSLADAAGPGAEGATIADLLAHSAGLDLSGTVVDSPGRRRIYSNAGYELAADRLAEAAGIPFADYLSEAVFEPLGMASTSLDGSPAAGATSTVTDLLAFATGLRRLLAPETVSMFTTPHRPELAGILPGYGRQDPNPWGLGPEIRSKKSPHWTGASNSPFTWGHFGQAGTFLWVDPLAETTLVVLTDRPFGDWAKPLWPAFSDTVLRH